VRVSTVTNPKRLKVAKAGTKGEIDSKGVTNTERVIEKTVIAIRFKAVCSIKINKNIQMLNTMLPKNWD
jgi:hypothetical protein